MKAYAITLIARQTTPRAKTFFESIAVIDLTIVDMRLYQSFHTAACHISCRTALTTLTETPRSVIVVRWRRNSSSIEYPRGFYPKKNHKLEIKSVDKNVLTGVF